MARTKKEKTIEEVKGELETPSRLNSDLQEIQDEIAGNK